MAALSFWTTARSSAMVLEARTLRMNCLTGGAVSIAVPLRGISGAAYGSSSWVMWPWVRALIGFIVTVGAYT